MNPLEWALLPLRRYAVFNGRSRRSEFWWFAILSGILGLLLDSVDMAMGSEIGLVGGIYNLALVIPSLSVTVRRLHDIDRSGWWLMIFVIPMVAFFAVGGLSFTEETQIEEMTGELIAATSAMLLSCIVLLVFSLLPGTTGPNRYGPDPHDESQD